MAIIDEEYIRIPIPFALPFLGVTEPTSLSINKAQFQLFMRIVVFVCSAFLFWPKIKGAFGFQTVVNTEEQLNDIQERIAKIEHERDMKKDSKKSYAVVTGPTDGEVTPAAEKAGAGPKRRKA